MEAIVFYLNPHINYLVRLSKHNGDLCVQTFFDLKSAKDYILDNKDVIFSATVYELTGNTSELITIF